MSTRMLAKAHVTYTVPYKIVSLEGVLRHALPFIAPGVRGLIREYDGAKWIVAMESVGIVEGCASKFLDSLTGRWRVPVVVNPDLEAMLKRRQFDAVTWRVTDVPGVGDEYVMVWMRE